MSEALDRVEKLVKWAERIGRRHVPQARCWYSFDGEHGLHNDDLLEIITELRTAREASR